MTWFGETMLYAQFLTQLVKYVISAGLPLPAGKEAICEFLAIVSEHFGYPDRTGLVQGFEERSGTGCCLVAFDLHIHSARSTVNGYEQIAA